MDLAAPLNSSMIQFEKPMYCSTVGMLILAHIIITLPTHSSGPWMHSNLYPVASTRSCILYGRG
ncbi:hypothetical protein E2C01_101721 [Portunus trituberculatus]|uniref:Uncharacterized protein n=1 Tax=Portunus trituberculatus TaxID=210409 RepID=A0A5B7KGS0_PORTR|nr:hypothetical protein [Portunus trituberculatus]